MIKCFVYSWDAFFREVIKWWFNVYLTWMGLYVWNGVCTWTCVVNGNEFQCGTLDH